eukprot:bmy_19122T0
MSEFWHTLGCCVVEKSQLKKKRRRLDQAMTGEPMNFVHLPHIGSREMGVGDGLAMTECECIAYAKKKLKLKEKPLMVTSPVAIRNPIYDFLSLLWSKVLFGENPESVNYLQLRQAHTYPAVIHWALLGDASRPPPKGIEGQRFRRKALGLFFNNGEGPSPL